MNVETKITVTNGNNRNRIPGSRIRFAVVDDAGQIVDRREMIAPMGGPWYCQRYPTGRYGRAYAAYLKWLSARAEAAEAADEAERSALLRECAAYEEQALAAYYGRA